ncbi:MAG: CHAP domain-containing protein [Phycicoccus sp.]
MSRDERATVLAVARAELNTREYPTGSNRVRYSTWYGITGPWCAMFVSWVASRAQVTDIIPRHAYTPDGAEWFKRRSRWGRTPRVGAIVYYEFPGMGRISHVGIVEQLHADGSWTAIEGNTDSAGSRTGGMVMRRRRRQVGARGGFGHPDYEAAADRAHAAANPPQNRLAIDGDLGPRTIRRWQQVMGTPVDGTISPSNSTLIREVQRTLNRRVKGARLDLDGTLGPATMRVLQRYLGNTPTSAWNVWTIRQLQRRLNLGRF